MTHYALAVDLGGTKVEAALVDSAGGLLAGSRHRHPTGAASTSDELAAAVTEAVRDALAALPAGATLLGAGIIVGAGLYLIRRERTPVVTLPEGG